MGYIERLRAEVARPGVRAVALRVVLIIAVISASYLVLANILLQTRVIRELVSEGPDVELSYASAYSLWPGRVRFERRPIELRRKDLQLGQRVARPFGLDLRLALVALRVLEAVALEARDGDPEQHRGAPGADVANRGAVEFRPAPGGRGNSATFRYSPAGGAAYGPP